MLLSVIIHVDPAHLRAAPDAGEAGYVLKSAAREELVEAVQSAINGRQYIIPSISDEREQSRDPRRAKTPLRLSNRERETLRLIAEGKSEKEIGYILGISTSTVSFHRINLKRKLALKSTAELTRYALEQGRICASAFIPFVDLVPAVPMVDEANSSADAVSKYECDTRAFVEQFIEGETTFVDCIQALNAALTLAIPAVSRMHFSRIKVAIQENTDRIRAEIKRAQDEAGGRPFLLR